jgi:hypothetical protein
MKFSTYDVSGNKYLLLEGNECNNCAFSKSKVRVYL